MFKATESKNTSEKPRIPRKTLEISRETSEKKLQNLTSFVFEKITGGFLIKPSRRQGIGVLRLCQQVDSARKLGAWGAEGGRRVRIYLFYLLLTMYCADFAVVFCSGMDGLMDGKGAEMLVSFISHIFVLRVAG